MSEAYYFKRFLSSINKHDSKETINALYQWIDKLTLEPPTIEHFVSAYDDGSLDQDLINITDFIKAENTTAVKLHEKAWSQARSKYLMGLTNQQANTLSDWVNP